MKFLKKAILIISAAAVMVASVGCQHKLKDSSSKKRQIGTNVIKVDLAQEADANKTVFTLNSVIDAGEQTDKGEHYIYLDVTIKNSTDTAYSLSTLNNFYLLMPDGSEISGHVRTELYAKSHFTDKYFGSPFDIPANGEFRGVIGGFVVDKDQKKFTVGFYPTREDNTDKESVVKIEVDESKIKPITSELFKG